MIRYGTERIARLWEEAEPLLRAHWAEIAFYKDIPLDPDRAAYNALEAAGATRCYTVREDGRLVGYAVFLVRQGLHYRGSVQAQQDVLFLLEPYRGVAGVRLIRYAEKELAAEGVQVVYHHAKRSNRVGELLERLGYRLTDCLYAKRLDAKGGS